MEEEVHRGYRHRYDMRECRCEINRERVLAPALLGWFFRSEVVLRKLVFPLHVVFAFFFFSFFYACCICFSLLLFTFFFRRVVYVFFLSVFASFCFVV